MRSKKTKRTKKKKRESTKSLTMTMTTVSPSASSSSPAVGSAAESTVRRKVQLVALLKECVVHLEKADNPPYTPLFHRALHALHEHAGNHIASLEHQINVLQQQKQQIIKDVEVMKKSSVANSGQQGPATTKKEPSTSAAAGAAATATASANDKLRELERVKKAQAEKRRQEMLEQRRKAAEEQKKKEQEEKRKFLEYEARKQQFKWHPTAAAAAATTTTTTTKADSNNNSTTTETASTASPSESAQPREKKSDHSLRSRMKDEMSAAFDKDSNLNPKQKQQQQPHSQYPSTQKQQQPSPIPQQQTTYNVGTPKGQRSQNSPQHNQQQSSNFTPRTFVATTSPMPNTSASSSTGFQTPIQHPPQQQQQQQHVHTSNTINSSSGHNSTPASWQSTQQQQHQQQAGHFSQPSMNIPHLPKQAPPHPTRQQPHQAHPSATASSQQQYHYHHPPTGSDRKYSQMSQHQRKAPQVNKSSSNDANKDKGSATSTKTPTSASPSSPPSSPPPSSMTELKRNILLNWALQPPEYQILKPIPILVCTIQSVFPPAFGLNYHEHFDGWKHVTSTDLVVSSSSTTTTTAAAAADNDFGGEWDSDKIKKIVRKLRFFLHPDKLPRDLSEQQIFCCQLLWDVTNDAYEDYKTSLEQLDWIHN